MRKEKEEVEVDSSTEAKIKEAARKMFTQKGYSATRTRDIAEEAGINLSLLNYYFRSKERLFQIVMNEKLELLFGILEPVVNDGGTSLEHKLEHLIQLYMNMLSENPTLPIFVMNELKNNQHPFEHKLSLKDFLHNSILAKQLNEKRPDLNPFHFLVNILGLCIFPYIAQPIFSATCLVNDMEFQQLMEERKKLIPKWTHTFLNTVFT